MVVVHISVHPRGLHPLEAAKAWHLHKEEGMRLEDVCLEVENLQGHQPSVKAVWTGVQMFERVRGTSAMPQSFYAKCGRKKKLSPEQEQAIVDFVATWRNKRFCTLKYIRTALKLKVHKKTIGNVLNRHGYYWRALPKVRGLSDSELAKRKEFVDTYLGKSPGWWQENMNLVLDGVTLTMAPKPLSKRQAHMQQSIKHTWLREGEELDPDCLHFNRYGVQLGVKVPLWGGFTGQGSFTLREWTPNPKMSKADWAARIPALKRAIDSAGEARRNVRAKVWHDNEKFLLQPDLYKRLGLEMQRFPPNSGDLNPIETVWAWLRRDLALREQGDFTSGRTLTVGQFRQRAAQILQSYGVAKAGESWSRLQKLIRGMPRRLAKCKAKRYGRCGK